ncbi:hypothetical protein AMECASPLE_007776 [Ameca splendens]|uniref:Uncharacterized protein n=1 Tax=Ameca splendens TaxID=208324 RepID=A0ABV0Y009_9TELE
MPTEQWAAIVRRHSGSKGLAQGPRVVICGIRTWPLVSLLEHKPPVLTYTTYTALQNSKDKSAVTTCQAVLIGDPLHLSRTTDQS